VGLAGTVAALGLPAAAPRALAATATRAAVPELSGTEFDLTISEVPMNLKGRMRPATCLNGSVPGPTLRWREGTTVTLRVHNRLSTPSSIHWHGIVLPFHMDGVPGISFAGIPPGQTFTYQFEVRQSGTYWYHSHSRFQEQTGLYGAIVIEPRNGEPIKTDRDHVILLSDWTDENPERIYTTLKQMSDYYNFHLPTAQDFIRDVKATGVKSALAKRRMWNEMRMTPTDLGDVSAATYAYLINGATPEANWHVPARHGERVRLRLINGSSSTFFDLRIPGLSMMVVSADGQAVEPVGVEEIRMGSAETYDVIVELPEDRAYTLFAQSMDRSGFARATLAAAPGMEAPIPAMDDLSWLTMKDMGMDSMGMAGHVAMQGMVHMEGMEMAGMNAMQKSRDPSQDMRVMHASTALDDPGPGLRDNGRKVLVYADLRTIGGSLDARAVTRELRLRLTGNMHRFIWGFDGKKYSESPRLHFDLGERLRVVLINDTMMSHPIHLHGMFGEIESSDGCILARKHTVVVQPGKQLSYLITADNPGQWAFHCHLLYHMEAGMFREVVVA
jgi:CopA family copper-resistance protein